MPYLSYESYKSKLIKTIGIFQTGIRHLMVENFTTIRESNKLASCRAIYFMDEHMLWGIWRSYSSSHWQRWQYPCVRTHPFDRFQYLWLAKYTLCKKFDIVKLDYIKNILQIWKSYQNLSQWRFINTDTGEEVKNGAFYCQGHFEY